MNKQEKEKVIIKDFLEEVNKAYDKFPTWPIDPIHRAAIVAEESGELVKAALEFKYEKGDKQEMRKEALQVAVTAFRFLVTFDNFDMDPEIPT